MRKVKGARYKKKEHLDRINRIKWADDLQKVYMPESWDAEKLESFGLKEVKTPYALHL